LQPARSTQPAPVRVEDEMRLAPALAGLDPKPAQLDEPPTRPLERYPVISPIFAPHP
jgi:hypothetical protein